MIRTATDNCPPLQGDGKVCVNRRPATDVTPHRPLTPLVDIRTHLFDMAHDPATCEVMTMTRKGDFTAIVPAAPRKPVGTRAKCPVAHAVMIRAVA